MQAIAGPTGATRSRVAPSCRGNQPGDHPDGQASLCPILVQIADRDTIAPPPGARAAAWRAKGKVEVREYPCEHFDIYLGDWRERAIADQLHFLRRHLDGADATEPREPASLTSET